MNYTKETAELLKMQMDHDLAVFKEFNTRPTLNQMKLALFDELGEVNHAAKIYWCWWKKSLQHDTLYQRTLALENAKDDILGELADVLHFIYCIALGNHSEKQNLDAIAADICSMIPKTGFPENYMDIIDTLSDSLENIIYAMSVISEADCVCKGKLYATSMAHMYKNVFVIASLFDISGERLIQAYKDKNKINRDRLANNY